MRKYERAFLIAALGLIAARGEAQEKPAEPRPGVVVEKTVYVPFEKLEAVFEKEGRGVFLPYEEFLRLWQAGLPKPPDAKPDVPPADAVIRGGLYTGTVTGESARFTVTLDVESLKQGWAELPLAFKGVAIESAELSNPRALFSAKPAAANAPEYAVYLPEPGKCQVKLQLSARVAQEPGKKTVSLGIPPAAVSRLELTIPEEDVRVDVLPAIAVKQSKPVAKSTQVVAFLGNSSDVAVSWMPPAGKVVEGGAVLFAEQAVRAYLGERILRVSALISIQALRGETDTIRVREPEGTRLLAVKGENIREWTEEQGVVVVKLHAPLKASSFQLSLGFERILDSLPPAITVPFARVDGVIRESGWVVLDHEAGLNVRVARSQGLSQADREEIPESLRDGLGVGFRYLAQPLALDLEVEKITPVIHAFTTSVITLGRDEDSWIGWIDYQIAKAGVFRLELRVPARWSVASVGDPGAVEDFQTSDANGVRTVTVSLKSKALGAIRLPFKLTAEGSAATGEATHSPPVLAGTTEDRGILGVSVPRAFELGTVSREKMAAADVDELFRSGILPQLAAGSSIPLAYSYREQPSSVKLRLEAKKTEIEVLAQHLIEIADGGVKLTHILDFEVLYAATDRIAFTAPSALDSVLKVEAKEKKEVRKASTAQGRTVWEIILQAPALGGVSVTLTHEMDLKALESGKPFTYAVPLPHAQDSREKGFIAIRKEGTLEIGPQATGMEAIEASGLPDKLRRGQIYGSFRYFTQDPALTLTLTRYEYQPLATTIVSLIRLESVLTEERKLRTRATLFVQNTERQYLELDLPPERILSMSVAGKTQQPRKRKDAAGTLVQIPASAGSSGTFPVVLVFEETLAEGAMETFGRASLRSLTVLEGVPVSKIEMDLYLPPGFVYGLWSGSLKPVAADAPTLWSRFKKIVNEAAGAPAALAAQAQQPATATPPPPAAGIDVELPTRGSILHRFETMAPSGNLSFAYASRMAFGLADFVAFLVALGVGSLLLGPAGWPVLRASALVLFLPLALTWFTSGPSMELATSLFAGGAAALLLTGVVRARRGLRARRAAKLAFAPDPFLEEAPTPRSGSAPDAAGSKDAEEGGGSRES